MTTTDTPFRGSYDGGGNDISGLRVDSGATGAPALLAWGLFGFVDSPATIGNVTLRNPAVTGARTSIGALVGRLGSGTAVTDSAVVGGTVSATGIQASIGGLAGSSSGRIDGSATAVSVNGSTSQHWGA